MSALMKLEIICPKCSKKFTTHVNFPSKTVDTLFKGKFHEEDSSIMDRCPSCGSQVYTEANIKLGLFIEVQKESAVLNK